MKKYFVVLNYTIGNIRCNLNWNKKDAIQWAKEMAQQGNNAKVYEGEFIKGFDANIKVVDDDSDLKVRKPKRKRPRSKDGE